MKANIKPSRKFLFINLVIIILSFACSDSQTGYNKSMKGSLMGIYFPDKYNGWAVGAYGAIFHTSDAGRSWSSQNSGINTNLYSVFFYNSNIGYTSGSSGILLKTTNGGKNWFKDRIPLSNHTNYIIGNDSCDLLFEISSSTAYKKRIYKIYSSNNRDYLWTQFSIGIIADLSDFSVSLFKTSYFALNSESNNTEIYKIGDKDKIGILLGSTDVNIENISFINDKTGWISSDNSIYRTTNSGKTWTNTWTWKDTTITKNVKVPTINKLYFINETLGFAAGYLADNVSFIRKTIDGGTSWKTVFEPRGKTDDYFAEYIYDIQFTDSQQGYAVGGLQNKIIQTSDCGESWVVINP
ncbi:MAG: hypothetical protein HW421_2445 [Ignavibacteria bacterium]|nr:hypothetical protein [Ignavibacteria bacterium]